MAPTLTVICAWCNRTLASAPDDCPVSHTICSTCYEAALAQRRPARDQAGAPPRLVEWNVLFDWPGRC
jgi:hypothetical protein